MVIAKESFWVKYHLKVKNNFYFHTVVLVVNSVIAPRVKHLREINI